MQSICAEPVTAQPDATLSVLSSLTKWSSLHTLGVPLVKGSKSKQLTVSGSSAEHTLQRSLTKAWLTHLSLGPEYTLPVPVSVTESNPGEETEGGALMC